MDKLFLTVVAIGLQTQNPQAGGISLPKLGLRTFRMQGDACRSAVESALALGYRHLDTAEMYGNEEAIGAAIAASGIAHKDLHVTTKVWNENLAPDAHRRAFDASLNKLRLDHVDLYLVHWPAPKMNLPEIFETLMQLKDEGRTPAIGVANFNIALLKTVVEDRGADRLQPGRIPCDAGPDAVAPVSHFEIASLGRLFPVSQGSHRFRRSAGRAPAASISPTSSAPSGSTG